VTDDKLKKAARKIAVLKFARSRELDAATNYFKAATEILQTAPARKLAANILPVEAQHVAVYDMVLGAEKPVNAPLFMDEV
jgi:rubrerythrin